MYALVDANNFYVSCERSMRPSLKTRPVVVLSNGDACCVARSNEAKALGIHMGQPWFECRELAALHGVVALSSNYPLYQDLSNRLMSIAAGLGPENEVYSLDEMFVNCHGVQGDLTARARLVRERILQWIGLPTGIGLGPTKTLAKLANHVAKSADRKPASYPSEFARVCNLGTLPASDLDDVLRATGVEDVWGIGRRIAKQLHAEGISNTLQLIQIDPATVRRRWSVVLERTVRELQGQTCLSLETQPPSKQEIAFTRSFGQPVSSLNELGQAVTEFASSAAAKLRKQGGAAGRIGVFIHTSPFRKQDGQYSRSATVPLRHPTADTALLVASALHGLRSIYRPGFSFVKAGVMLLDLRASGHEQGELSLQAEPAQSGNLMSTLDQLNDRYGRGTVHLASAGLGGKARPWTMNQAWLTPQYTTDWTALPQAKA